MFHFIPFRVFYREPNINILQGFYLEPTLEVLPGALDERLLQGFQQSLKNYDSQKGFCGWKGFWMALTNSFIRTLRGFCWEHSHILRVLSRTYPRGSTKNPISQRFDLKPIQCFLPRTFLYYGTKNPWWTLSSTKSSSEVLDRTSAL